MSALELVPITFAKAKEYVKQHHRHHKPPQGHKYSIGLKNLDKDELVGIVMVGRPVNRYLDDGYTAEVIRLATDGTTNACSMLYGAAWRSARGMGYKRMITYILASEPGTSLKASNWKLDGEVKGSNAWTQRKKGATGYSEKRQLSDVQMQNKQRWVVSVE